MGDGGTQRGLVWRRGRIEASISARGNLWGGYGNKHQEMESGRLRKRGEREGNTERAGKKDRQTEKDGESLRTAVYERKSSPLRSGSSPEPGSAM